MPRACWPAWPTRPHRRSQTQPQRMSCAWRAASRARTGRAADVEPLVSSRFGFAGPAPGPFVMKPVYRLEGVGWYRHVGWVVSMHRSFRDSLRRQSAPLQKRPADSTPAPAKHSIREQRARVLALESKLLAIQAKSSPDPAVKELLLAKSNLLSLRSSRIACLHRSCSEHHVGAIDASA